MTDKRSVYTPDPEAVPIPRAVRSGRSTTSTKARPRSWTTQFLALVNDFAAKYDTLTDTDATAMLKTKMQIEKERMDLKQTYTKKIAKVLPAVKALRYAQVETRIDNMLRRNVYGLIPLAQ